MTRLLLPLLLAASALAQGVIPDSEIRRILVQRVDEYKQSVGIVAGVVDANGRRFVSHGSLGQNDSRTLGAGTVFEIGSVTKVFTSLLLADMALRGEVALADPVWKYLPEIVRVPSRGGNAITLEELASHYSGLPRLPDNLNTNDPLNPYAGYRVENLYQFLSGHQLRRSPGVLFEYSNLGAGLLGHALALRAGTSYEALIESRIAAPLGMSSTAITLTADMQRRLATGHNARLEPVPLWDLPALAGAGALRSTAADLLNFVSAALGYRPSPLADAFALMLKQTRSAGPSMQVGLGWLVAARDGREIVWHNGGTGGFRAFVGFDPKSRAGAVVLSNASTPEGVDDIGMRLLNPAAPLFKPRREVSLDPKILDRYAGRYQLAPDTILSVTREDARLFLEAARQPKIELHAESEREFFLNGADVQIAFEPDGSALTLTQNGRPFPAGRIE
jgi:D-alanyl-D-alanine-carboxypeptidase/D-alanyl-D-alanine-endopeptidase